MSFTVILESESDSDGCSVTTQMLEATEPSALRDGGGSSTTVRTFNNGEECGHENPSFGPINETEKYSPRRCNQAPIAGIEPSREVVKTNGRRRKILYAAILGLVFVLSTATLSYCIPTLVMLKKELSGNFSQSHTLTAKIEELSKNVEAMQKENAELKHAIKKNMESISANAQLNQQNVYGIEWLKSAVRDIRKLLERNGASQVQINTTLIVTCIAVAGFY